MLGALRNFAASFNPLKQALADRAYRDFAVANLLAFIGVWMQRLILGWLVWDATSSAFWLSLLALCDFAPALLLGPIGGVLGDRLDQARLILVCQAILALNTLAAGWAVALSQPIAWLLIAFALVGGAASTLSDAARLGIIRRLAAPDALGASVAVSAISYNVARFAGPALAGGVMLAFGAGAGLVCAALMGAPLLWVLRRQGAPPAQAATRTSWWQDLINGAAYTFGHRSIGAAMLLFGLGCLLVRPIYELMPGLVDRLWGGGAGVLSAMVAAIGFGAMLGAIGLTRAGVRPGPVVLRGVIGSALSLIALLAASSAWLALALAAMLGLFISTTANGALILAQTEADPAYQARVASIWSIIIRGGPAVGALAIGAVADGVGFRAPVLTGALVCLCAAVAVWRNDRMRRRR